MVHGVSWSGNILQMAWLAANMFYLAAILADDNIISVNIYQLKYIAKYFLTIAWL